MSSSLSDLVSKHNNTRRKKCPYSELFWFAFSRIRTEYGDAVKVTQTYSSKIIKIIEVRDHRPISFLILSEVIDFYHP